MSLNNIPIQIKSKISLGTLLPLLHEIRHALTRLLHQKEETAIDLRNFPLSQQDKQTLFQILGKGEIQAELTALGRSLIWETKLPGLWVVEHYNTDEILLSQSLEVTGVPSILKSPLADIQHGLENLQEWLKGEKILNENTHVH